jgi:hypothetical protein
MSSTTPDPIRTITGFNSRVLDVFPELEYHSTGMLDSVFSMFRGSFEMPQLDGISGKDIYEVSVAIDFILGDSVGFRPQDYLLLYGILRQKGVPHADLVQAYIDLADMS